MSIASRLRVFLAVTTFVALPAAGPATAHLQIDPDASAVMLFGSIDGEPFTAQAPGSRMTSLSGEILVETTAAGIEFLPGSNITLATGSLGFEPGPAPAQLAAEATGFLILDRFLAVRDLTFGATSQVIPTNEVGGVQEFPVDPITIDFRTGTVGVRVSGSGTGSDAVAGRIAQLVTSGMSAELVNGVAERVLTIPFQFSLQATAAGVVSDLNFQGTIVAREAISATCDADRNGQVDGIDIALFMLGRFGPAFPPFDALDVDGDGVLTNADLRACIPLCSDDVCTQLGNAVSSFVIRRVR